MISCKDNKTKLFYQQDQKLQNLPYAHLQSNHLACVCECMLVGVCVYVCDHTDTCSSLSTHAKGLKPQTNLLSVRTRTLFESSHSSPNTASAETETHSYG